VYVAAVRRLFATADPPHHPITTLPEAYQLDIPPYGVDLTAFEMLVDRAGRRAAAGRMRAADQALAGALAMWSGPPLGGLVGEYFQRAAVRLEERRIAVLEQHVGVKLALDDEGVL